MARKLEERVDYGGGTFDEWGPYTGRVNVHGWSDKQIKEFVRDANKAAKARGDGTRLRSVETDDFW